MELVHKHATRAYFAVKNSNTLPEEVYRYRKEDRKMSYSINLDSNGPQRFGAYSCR